jgi:type II secretory ATPase GspE/PulE/Tfp pilus assembly ATPase PilB-like protein
MADSFAHKESITVNSIVRTTRSTTIESDAHRIHIERSAGRLAVRLRPSGVELELTAADALAFADALAEQAQAMQRAARAYAAEQAHRAQQVAA